MDAHVDPDSGASANVTDEHQFRALKHRSQEIEELQPSRDTLKTLQSDHGNTPKQEQRSEKQVFRDPREDGLTTTAKQEHTL